jgi:hypothetical protein
MGIKKVTAFLASDGSLHISKDKAIDYEAQQELTNLLSDDLKHLGDIQQIVSTVVKHRVKIHKILGMDTVVEPAFNGDKGAQDAAA